MRNNLNQFLFLVLLLIGLIQACHPKAAPLLERVERTDLRSYLNQGPYAWEWFSCTGQIDMKSSMFTGSGQYTLRMQKDSLLWAVVRFMGMEVARIQADQDSMVVLNRFERKVDVYSWKAISDKTGYPASLSTLQRTVLGWLPLVTESLQLVKTTNEGVEVMGKEGMIQLTAILAEPDLIPSACLYRDLTTGLSAEGAQIVNNGPNTLPVPGERSWDMRSDEKSRLFLRIQVNDPDLAGPLQFPFDIPERYARQ